MYIDHSKIYRDKSMKNLPHRRRLKKIMELLDPVVAHRERVSFADVGCSNGYVTAIIKQRYNMTKVVGYDANKENLRTAGELHNDIEFKLLNLMDPQAQQERYTLVTCFETLEHVGDVHIALRSLYALVQKGGILLISVPIEIGFWGLLKFILKTAVYGYDMAELKGDGLSRYIKYFIRTALKGDIASFRKAAKWYGSHFGFDYRVIDQYLKNNKLSYASTREFTTMFYVIAV